MRFAPNSINIKNQRLMENSTAKSIIAELIVSEKGNMVWRVKVDGSRSKKDIGYCKTALAAIRCCYMLQKRTGNLIAENVMKRLRAEHYGSKKVQEGS